ncbi:hypothetical protein [Vibrio gallicus]|uniref:hypothetical protein n=1 Tax=Vibrio gallicus TaxID=190897 RepID=UPI0021C4920C|nr:hypothetical protein [Vibrio gallicus]
MHQDFIRINCETNKLVLQVCQIDWPAPHEPSETWVTAKSLDSSIELMELDAEIQYLLSNPKYFGFCTQCKAHFVIGMMHSDSHCHSCAERCLGIVY